MFQRDGTFVRDWVNVGSEGWEDRAAACMLVPPFTIKTLTPSVTTHTAKFAAGDLSTIYMQRRPMFDYIKSGAHRDMLREVDRRMRDGDDAGALMVMAGVPGLALAKAGFVLQLLYGAAGCLDTRNLKEFGVKEIRWDKNAKIEARYKAASLYLDLCNRLGGCEFMWDNWCGGVARQYKKSYAGDASKVSAEHVVWVLNCYQGLWR